MANSCHGKGGDLFDLDDRGENSVGRFEEISDSHHVFSSVFDEDSQYFFRTRHSDLSSVG